ncbi:MAG TPA: fatty acid desaturase [Spirochaetia bacterium]|nr:fatty acid desaturase [Spirochaetia bacterium]
MATAYEPLQQVRKELQIRWYRCPIEPARLRELTARSDIRGFFQALGHIALIAITGAATWLFFDARIWVGFAVALFAHGTIYSFLASGTHELAHGTVFKTKWLNNVFLYFLSLVSWFNFFDYKMSHTYHHLYTLHPRGDREVHLPNSATLHPLHILQLLTLNLIGGRGEPYSFPIIPNIKATVKLAFTGKYSHEWLEAVYVGQEEARKRSIRWARTILAFNLAIIAVSVVFRLWPLPLIVTLAPFTANLWRYLVYVPMHTGLRDNVPDFRLCVRSITLDPLSHFIYWRMNWHLEHHMFAAVPCYNLRRLHKTVASDMPRPRTLIGAWREMRQTWKRQMKEPGYQFDTPLPGGKVEKARKQDTLESSIGELDPRKPD